MNIGYSDGWIRTFGNPPKLNNDEKKLLTTYINSGSVEEILIYLEHYRGITGEIAEFLLRELTRGTL
uniref:Uncharacterized protein n=1 Tax=viral metagenome TaxID=1070528 RepID=A0A6H2A1V8_9ZZZZ